MFAVGACTQDNPGPALVFRTSRESASWGVVRKRIFWVGWPPKGNMKQTSTLHVGSGDFGELSMHAMCVAVLQVCQKNVHLLSACQDSGDLIDTFPRTMHVVYRTGL